jgi:putative nucleotidyltransferase with HDIG domain
LQVISVEELLNYERLPFDIYNEKGKILFNEGEELTPGKILQLKYIPLLYIKENLQILDDSYDELFDELEQQEPQQPSAEKIIHQAFDIKSQYENESSVVPVHVQKELKSRVKEMLDSFNEEGIKDPAQCYDVRDRIIEEVLPEVDNILYRSQLQMYGDYNYSHGINVAMLSAVLAEKLKTPHNVIQDITLAAMLHDVGKLRIPRQILEKTAHSPSEVKLIHLHPRLGHKIILKELNLPENIANVALQHHERSDGSGYPYGISGEKISFESHVVMICNVYDDLTSGKGPIKVRNSKDAIKILLEIGSKWFRTDALYTFVHMTNYNDNSVIYNY